MSFASCRSPSRLLPGASEAAAEGIEYLCARETVNISLTDDLVVTAARGFWNGEPCFGTRRSWT
jgi:hypothetical protein